MKNKKGQGLSTNAIILIILGIVVLVILAIGFTFGWGKLNPFLQTNNVEQIKTACTTSCATGNVFDFCTQERNLKVEGLPGNVKEVKGNCSFFSEASGYEKYGIEACSSVECSPSSSGTEGE